MCKDKNKTEVVLSSEEQPFKTVSEYYGGHFQEYLDILLGGTIKCLKKKDKKK